MPQVVTADVAPHIRDRHGVMQTSAEGIQEGSTLYYEELMGQGSPQIRFPDVIAVLPWSAGLDVLVGEPLEVGHASWHGLEVLDPLGVDHPHFAPEVFEAKGEAVVDDAGDCPPGIQAIKIFSAVVERTGCARR